jgi:hypothetical protein
MERRFIATSLALLLVAAAAGAQDVKKKADAAPEAGPFTLPTVASVKEKCKPTEAQAPKLDAIYADAVKSEADIRRRAKEAESDRKTLEKFLADGRLEVVLKVKELFDAQQDKTFDDLVTAAAAAGMPKKKK